MAITANVNITFEINMSTILTELPEDKQYWEMYKIIHEKITEITSTKKGLLDFLHTDDLVAEDIKTKLSFCTKSDNEKNPADTSSEMSLDVGA